MSNHIFKALREKLGITQGQLGVAMGMPVEKAQSRVSHYESGRRDIPIDVAYRFIDFAEEHGVVYGLEDLYPRISEMDEAG